MNKLSDIYFRIDLRSLGLFRILMACVLIHDWLTRWPDLEAFYTLAGAMPTDVAAWHPVTEFYFSPLDWFTTLSSVQIIFCVGLLCYVLLLAGYQTRLFAVLSFLFYVSIVNRNVMIRAHSDVVVVTMMLWAIFLPLGKRFSADAWLRRKSIGTEERRPTLSDPSLAAFAIILQIGLIYFWTAFAKSGETWRNGTALYYALHYEPLVRSAGHWLGQQSPWLLFWLTWGSRLLEFAALPLIFIPVTLIRRALIVALTALHIGIAITMDVGNFPLAMISLNAVLLRAQDWEMFGSRQPTVAWTPVASEAPGLRRRALFIVKEAVVAVLLAAVLIDGANFMRVTMKLQPVQEPALVRAIIQSTQAIQDWNMFAPDPPRKSISWSIYGTKGEITPFTTTTILWDSEERGTGKHNRFWRYYLYRLGADQTKTCGNACARYFWSQCGGISKKGEPLDCVYVWQLDQEILSSGWPSESSPSQTLVGSHGTSCYSP